MKPRQILFIDDKETCHLFDILLSHADKNLQITCATTREEAIDLVKKKSFDLYILEPFRHEINGLELCRRIRQKDARTPVIFYSGMSREIDRSMALAAGANAYLVKGTDLDKFIETVKEFLS